MNGVETFMGASVLVFFFLVPLKIIQHKKKKVYTLNQTTHITQSIAVMTTLNIQTCNIHYLYQYNEVVLWKNQ